MSAKDIVKRIEEWQKTKTCYLCNSEDVRRKSFSWEFGLEICEKCAEDDKKFFESKESQIKTTTHQCPHCHKVFEEKKTIHMTARF